MLAATSAYLFAALRRAYGEPTGRAAAKAPLLAFGVMLVLLAYRFVLFLVTLRSL